MVCLALNFFTECRNCTAFFLMRTPFVRINRYNAFAGKKRIEEGEKMKKKNKYFDGVGASVDKQHYIGCFIEEQKKPRINEVLRVKILRDFLKKSLWSTEGKEKICRYHR